jgi:ABC-2 type transport system ATP-binding protein
MIRDGRMIAVREIAELQAAQPRIVRLEFADAAAAAAFAVAGAERRELDGVRLRFAYAGESAALLRALADEPIVDIEIEKASLEDIFLALYR